jgi:predicted NodU family carbamoyl transferase
LLLELMAFLLGIHGAHNSSVAIFDLNDPKLIGNLEVERVTGKKNDDRMDEDIISKILNLFGIKTDEIAGIAYGYSCNPFRKVPESFDLSVRESSQFLFGKQLRAFLIPHHLSHAASCAIVSPHSRTLVITADGWGDNLNTCLFLINKDSLTFNYVTLFAGYVHRAPAHLWESICRYNYKMAPLTGPGKLMALAAYGKPSIEWDEKIIGY